VGTLDDVNPTRLSKRSQGCPLTLSNLFGSYLPKDGDEDAVMPYKSLGKLSDIPHLNNRNKQLER